MRRRSLGALAVAPLFGGCGLIPPPTTVPMPVRREAAGCAASTLVVMLPGAYSRPGEFIEAGFVDAMRRRGLAADVWIPDAHLRYYEERSVFVRLEEDVLAPARSRYPRIWIVGISLGGFGALGCAALQADALAGIVLLAPYLGTRTVLQEIAAAGGPAAWRQRVIAGGGPAADDMERRNWLWLTAPTRPVYLGYGVEDRFAPQLRALDTVLPAGRITTVPGGHDWPPWLALWNGWLDRNLVEERCTA